MKYFIRINNKADLVHSHINRIGKIDVAIFYKDCGRLFSNVRIRTYPEYYEDVAKELYMETFDNDTITKIERIVGKNNK